MSKPGNGSLVFFFFDERNGSLVKLLLIYFINIIL